MSSLRRLKEFAPSGATQEFGPEVGLWEVDVCRRLERMKGTSDFNSYSEVHLQSQLQLTRLVNHGSDQAERA
jgi:hypothetical protein